MYKIEVDNYFKLFANCIPVYGYSRSAICDLQRHVFQPIPNELYNIIKLCDTIPLITVLNKYKTQKQFFSDYFDYLISNNFGWLCSPNELQLFPPMSLYWDFPSDLVSAIVCWSEDCDLLSILNQLDKLSCFYIQFIFFDIVDEKIIEDIISKCDKTSIRSIQLVISFKTFSSKEHATEFIKSHDRIAKIECFDSPFEEINNIHGEISKIIYYSEKINSVLDCGKVDPKFFCNNISHFTESQKYNSCLNRKICIDKDGNIKNCPSMTTSYGNIKDTKIKKVIINPEFRKLWSITKDHISVCKDCEFRYICTDCRVYTKFAGDVFSQPLKCTYNPYICKWSHEDGYIPIEDCGQNDISSDFIPNNEKIKEFNKMINE